MASTTSARLLQGSMSCAFRATFGRILRRHLFWKMHPPLNDHVEVTVASYFNSKHQLTSQLCLRALNICCFHMSDTSTFTCRLKLKKGVCVCVCFPWRGLEVLIPACELHDSVMTLCSSLPHWRLAPRLPSQHPVLHKKPLTHPPQHLKRQHCLRILILIDYMAASWCTKGLWMGGKWST